MSYQIYEQNVYELQSKSVASLDASEFEAVRKEFVWALVNWGAIISPVAELNTLCQHYFPADRHRMWCNQGDQKGQVALQIAFMFFFRSCEWKQDVFDICAEERIGMPEGFEKLCRHLHDELVRGYWNPCGLEWMVGYPNENDFDKMVVTATKIIGRMM